MFAFFATLERELEKVEFFRPPEKRATMSINLRNIFTRMELTRQDIQTLHGAVTAIAEGRKGPAKGGILDGREAGLLRELLAEHGGGRVPGERGPVRGLSRLLRRNPTAAERALWDALTRDRRFAGRGFKRQVPIGPHIVDMVSFPLRAVIDLVPAEESAEAARARADKAAFLAARDYLVCRLGKAAIEASIAAALDDLARHLRLGAGGDGAGAAAGGMLGPGPPAAALATLGALAMPGATWATPGATWATPKMRPAPAATRPDPAPADRTDNCRRWQQAGGGGGGGYSSASSPSPGSPLRICSAISPEFCRIAASMRAAISGLLRRNALAFSRPWPMRWLS